MHFRVKSAMMLVGCIALAGCASTPGVLKQQATPVVQNAPLPAPHGSQGAAVRPYMIGPYDTLSIKVFGVEELDLEEVKADSGGNISVPMLGSISAIGKTPSELATEIERGLRSKHIRDPQVAVNLKEMVSQVFTIDGQVDEPGSYPVLGNMTLVRAVATAGGLSEFANLDDVVVFRTVGGEKMAGLYNLGAVRSGLYADPTIYPDDVIVIGDSSARRMFKDLLQSAPLLSTPLLILFRRD